MALKREALDVQRPLSSVRWRLRYGGKQMFQDGKGALLILPVPSAMQFCGCDLSFLTSFLIRFRKAQGWGSTSHKLYNCIGSKDKSLPHQRVAENVKRVKKIKINSFVAP